MTCALVTAGNTSTPANQLLKRLKAIQLKGVMVGHQDDPVYGQNWKWERGRSDVKEVCGDYPAVMGFELGGIELGHEANIDQVPFDRMRDEIIEQHLRGGISTLSWHPFNPVTGKNAWDPSGNPVRTLLCGGAQQDKFEQWIGIVANFLNSLKTPNGQKIPVIFRPWHEMNGGWFWWGAESTTPEEFKQLFVTTHQKLTKDYGCDHLVWCYSPNTGFQDYLAQYPGDSYVDILGIDIYDFKHDNATYTKNVKHDLSELTRIGKEKQKLIALTETGAQQLPDANWFTEVFWKAVEPFPISYALFWRNAWDNHKELYMAAPGHLTAPNFKKFYKIEKTLFVNDMKDIK